MANPILEQMGAGRKSNIASIVEMMRGKSPKEAITAMCNANPAFRDFYETNKDKPIDDVCRSYGVNPVILRNLFKS